MTETVTGDYTLVATELPSIRTWISFQNNFGTGTKQISNADAANYIQGLSTLSSAYPGIQNLKIKGFFDQLFSLIGEQDDAANMYLVWQFVVFLNGAAIRPAPPDAVPPDGGVDPWISYWDVFAITKHWGWSTPWTGTDEHATWVTSLSLPGAPAAWASRVAGILSKWGASPPASLINVGITIDARGNAISFENSVLQAWPNFLNLVSGTSPVWQAQSATVTAMLKEKVLPADAYFFLLHLLIALGTSNTSDQQLAKKVAGAAVNSEEYPNDMFSNQVVYLSLMYFADPLGHYGYSNQQLQGLLTDILSVVVNTDPATQVIKLNLNNQLKILRSDASYPMQDPYNPNIGFNTRMSDTLSALDNARNAISS